MGEQKKREDIYDELYSAGLMSKLLQEVQAIRPGVSRNTLRLAIVNGPTTPLRRKILELAESIANNKEYASQTSEV